MTNRQTKILEIVTERNRIEVAKLAELLGVSQVTTRKDLDQLEMKGLIKREHGFALLSSNDDINNRLAYHYDLKRRIAQAAAGLVRDGETVMIESGSCCALLADELCTHKRDVTIVTNSAFIAGYIRRLPAAKIILLGGDYQNESQVMVGPVARQCVRNFFVNKLFIGADGFRQESGFTGNDLLRAETVRDMAAQADKVIVLTESRKFSRQGVVTLLPTKQVAVVQTDDAIPLQQEQFLRQQGVEVRKVPGEENK